MILTLVLSNLSIEMSAINNNTVIVEIKNNRKVHLMYLFFMLRKKMS